jgi:hypothetical protein
MIAGAFILPLQMYSVPTGSGTVNVVDRSGRLRVEQPGIEIGLQD